MPHRQPPHSLLLLGHARTRKDSSSPLNDESRTSSEYQQNLPPGSRNEDSHQRSRSDDVSRAPSGLLHHQPLEHLPKKKWARRKDRWKDDVALNGHLRVRTNTRVALEMDCGWLGGIVSFYMHRDHPTSQSQKRKYSDKGILPYFHISQRILDVDDQRKKETRSSQEKGESSLKRKNSAKNGHVPPMESLI